MNANARTDTDTETQCATASGILFDIQSMFLWMLWCDYLYCYFSDWDHLRLFVSWSFIPTFKIAQSAAHSGYISGNAFPTEIFDVANIFHVLGRGNPCLISDARSKENFCFALHQWGLPGHQKPGLRRGGVFDVALPSTVSLASPAKAAHPSHPNPQSEVVLTSQVSGEYTLFQPIGIFKDLDFIFVHVYVCTQIYQRAHVGMLSLNGWRCRFQMVWWAKMFSPNPISSKTYVSFACMHIRTNTYTHTGVRLRTSYASVMSWTIWIYVHVHAQMHSRCIYQRSGCHRDPTDSIYISNSWR